ncbi:MAG TPA: sigma-70 family RNA polymerase sigma factor [Caulobacter sp.]|nr:sigma-70 family RNA polymerase sigma factor [Caulobacter sp.]
MNVVRLFPVVEESLGEEASAELAPQQPALSQPTLMRLARRRGPSPVEVLAGAVRRPAGRLTPAGVIARALDRPAPAEAFWPIWLAHQDALRSRSLRLSGGNRADAEDALSNAMVRAAQAFARQPVQNPGAWLLRILHNTCMDQHRQNAGRAAIDEQAIDAPAARDPAWTKPEPSPEEALTQSERDRAWRRALASLPRALVDPLRLHLDDWTDDEIARHLQISRELVRKRRQKAKERLRELLRY